MLGASGAAAVFILISQNSTLTFSTSFHGDFLVRNSVSFLRFLRQSFESVIGAQVERMKSMKDVTFLYSFCDNAQLCEAGIISENQLFHQ